MTDDEIEAILARAAKSPRPWTDGDERCHCTHCGACGHLFRTADIHSHRDVCLSRRAEELIPALVSRIRSLEAERDTPSPPQKPSQRYRRGTSAS